MAIRTLRHIFALNIISLIVLYSLTADFLVIIWTYQLYFWSAGYLILGMGSISVLLEVQNGILAVLVVLLYPTYVLTSLAMWSFVGTYFEDMVSE